MVFSIIDKIQKETEDEMNIDVSTGITPDFVIDRVRFVSWCFDCNCQAPAVNEGTYLNMAIHYPCPNNSEHRPKMTPIEKD